MRGHFIEDAAVAVVMDTDNTSAVNDPSVSQLVFTITEKALVGAFSVIVQLHRLIDLRH